MVLTDPKLRYSGRSAFSGLEEGRNPPVFYPVALRRGPSEPYLSPVVPRHSKARPPRALEKTVCRELGQGFVGRARLCLGPKGEHFVEKEFFRYFSSKEPGDNDRCPPLDPIERGRLASVQEKNFRTEQRMLAWSHTTNNRHVCKGEGILEEKRIISPYYPGGSLEQLRQRLWQAEDKGGVSKEGSHQIALYLLRDLLMGLVSLARSDVVHRDLKPDNIFLDLVKNHRGEVVDVHAIIGDLGAAIRGKNPAEVIPLDPHYTSPEVLAVRRGERSSYDQGQDIWSLGVSFYQLLYRQFPRLDWHRESIVVDYVNRGQDLFAKPQQAKGANGVLAAMLKPAWERPHADVLLKREEFLTEKLASARKALCQLFTPEEALLGATTIRRRSFELQRV